MRFIARFGLAAAMTDLTMCVAFADEREEIVRTA